VKILNIASPHLITWKELCSHIGYMARIDGSIFWVKIKESDHNKSRLADKVKRYLGCSTECKGETELMVLVSARTPRQSVDAVNNAILRNELNFICKEDIQYVTPMLGVHRSNNLDDLFHKRIVDHGVSLYECEKIVGMLHTRELKSVDTAEAESNSFFTLIEI